jgi:UDP-2,3-diacylglucosamine pyrophosphatase LpxH
MKYKTIILSDIHLGTLHSRAKEVLKFMETISADEWILNGDIVDGWALGRGSIWKNSHTKVLSKIIDLSRKSKVVWIRGNHDEFLHQFMHMHLGNLHVAEEYILSVGPLRYLVLHGDVLDVFVARWKYLARLGAWGYDCALQLNTWYNQYRAWRGKSYYSISKDIKAGVKAAVNYITDFELSAVKLAEQRGCHGVICGHIHSPANRQIAGIHYLNTGDWVENMTAIAITHDGEIHILSN